MSISLKNHKQSFPVPIPPLLGISISSAVITGGSYASGGIITSIETESSTDNGSISLKDHIHKVKSVSFTLTYVIGNVSKVFTGSGAPTTPSNTAKPNDSNKSISLKDHTHNYPTTFSFTTTPPVTSITISLTETGGPTSEP